MEFHSHQLDNQKYHGATVHLINKNIGNKIIKSLSKTSLKKYKIKLVPMINIIKASKELLRSVFVFLPDLPLKIY